MSKIHVMSSLLYASLISAVACRCNEVPPTGASQQGLTLVGSYGTLETDIGDRVEASCVAAQIQLTVIHNHGWNIFVPPNQAQRARQILTQIRGQHPSLRVH